MPAPAKPGNNLQIKGRITNSTSGEVFLNNEVLNIVGTAGGSEDYVLNIGTTEESFTWSVIEDAGYVWIENLDATNFVQVQLATSTPGNYAMKLFPGYFALFPLDLTRHTIFLKADTAACAVRLKAYEI